MGRAAFLAAAGALLVAFGAATVPSSAAPSEPDDRVTPTAYVRHDGGTDRAIQHCSDTSTSTAPDIPNDGDTDSNGGAFRQGNEPTVAIDPTNPNLVMAAWNDYCDTDLGGGWMGIAHSRDRGETWTPSKIPGIHRHLGGGHGLAAPRQAGRGRRPTAGIRQRWQPLRRRDRLQPGEPQNGDVWVATYGAQPHPSGYPKDYLRTVVVGTGTRL